MERNILLCVFLCLIMDTQIGSKMFNPFSGFWMSDKPLVQQALASELAEILLSITSTPLSLSFLRGFWETTVREWNGIDRLR